MTARNKKRIRLCGDSLRGASISPCGDCPRTEQTTTSGCREADRTGLSKNPKKTQTMSQQNPLSFDIELKKETVVIGGKKYELRELDGIGRDKHLADSAARSNYDGEGKFVSLKSGENMRAYLVHLSLFDESGKNVPVSEIQSWPSRVSEALHARAVELSGLNAKTATEQAKNG